MSIVLKVLDLVTRVKDSYLWGRQAADNTNAEQLESTNGGLNVWVINGSGYENWVNDPVAGYLSVSGKFTTVVDFNPHAASTGATLTAGTLGATESVIANFPCLLGGVVFHGDSAAGNLIIRDAAATAQNLAPIVLASTQNQWNPNGHYFANGIAAIGSVAGLMARFYLKKV